MPTPTMTHQRARNMIGMDKNTGLEISGLAHLKQSIQDILTTRKGTRVMRRDYGSNLPNLIDAPVNRETLLDIYAETAQALIDWEPRIDVSSVVATSAEVGQVILSITGTYLPDGQKVTLDGIVVK